MKVKGHCHLNHVTFEVEFAHMAIVDCFIYTSSQGRGVGHDVDHVKIYRILMKLPKFIPFLVSISYI